MNSSEFNTYLESIISTANEQNLSSFDVSDLSKTWYFKQVRKVNILILKRILLFPYNWLKKYKPESIRRFVKEKNFKYAQGHAMYIRGLVSYFKVIEEPDLLIKAKDAAEWLIQNRNPKFKNYAWGQPFLWYSSKGVIFPINIPRTTVTSQVAWAFLDLYEVTQEEKYLKIVQSICKLYINDFNYQEDTNGNVCFSYTTIDNYHVHNASLLAASVLSRAYRLTNNQSYRNYARKSIDFTISHQNEDGSFYYWAPPNKVNFVIDNYHTGFVVECLKTIVDDFNDENYKMAYEKGLNFYFENLFEGPIPKLTPKKIHPIDIQSCAQSIITFALDGRSKYLEKAKEIAAYSVNNFFIKEKSYFGYRIYQNGFRDRSYYFRWGDAWMIKALALLNEKESC